MSTNHNRIKVADLETNAPDKILKTNENGELEFSNPISSTNHISIQDSLGVEKFKTSDFIRFKGASFNVTDKQVEVNPLVSGVIFVSSTGNDSTAEPENRNKPYLTLNAAINAFFSYQNIFKIEILSSTSFTISRSLNDGTTRTFQLHSEVSPTVNITFNGLYGISTQQLIFTLNNGTLNLSPTTSASFGNNANRTNIIIKAKNVTKNASFGNGIIGGFRLDCDNLSVTGSEGLVGACVMQLSHYIKAKNISFLGAGASLFAAGYNSAGEWLLDFDNITHDNTFSISCWVNKFNINHGNISSPNSFPNWVSYCPLFNSNANINYKTGAVISSNVGFHRFNNNAILFLSGTVSYTNTEVLFHSVNYSNVILNNAVITTKGFAGGRQEGTIKIVNSTINVTSYFLSIDNNNINYTYLKPILEFQGNCFVLGLGLEDNFNLVSNFGLITSNKPWIDLKKAILYTNGKFPRTKLDILENTLNQYNKAIID
ncbi:hypothetical protein [Flavobacterium sp. DG2-3]|uniref:hypothetical protein n=1 Tax=Flavobacterium sp. DG2-3 TaxID=3068317 RepID=UPI00273FE433|nr:hypothetical protein [Flavobacterium sp. DG2-3]MDP5201123.1 hypothetical protein [Flavobacterium sp. DG2-3]